MSAGCVMDVVNLGCLDCGAPLVTGDRCMACFEERRRWPLISTRLPNGLMLVTRHQVGDDIDAALEHRDRVRAALKQLGHAHLIGPPNRRRGLFKEKK